MSIQATYACHTDHIELLFMAFLSVQGQFLSKFAENSEGNASMKFSDLRLSPGDIMQLQFEDDFEERYFSRLIGYLEGKSIIITTPVDDGKVLRVRSGQSVVVRTMASSAAGAFSSYVEAIGVSPYHYLHIGFPADISMNEVRQSPRVGIDLVVSASNTSNSSGSEKKAGVIIDISTTGARLQVESELGGVGDEIDIIAQLSVSNIDRIITIPAIIRSRLQSPKQDNQGNPKPTYGVEYKLTHEDDRVFLHAFVYENIVTQ